MVCFQRRKPLFALMVAMILTPTGEHQQKQWKHFKVNNFCEISFQLFQTDSGESFDFQLERLPKKSRMHAF